MNATSIAFARLQTEEGKRQFAYNDATGKRVTCQPGGNLTIGYGINLETGLDEDEQNWLLMHRLSKVADGLAQYAWYTQLDDARASVVLDVAYNAGLNALLHYVHMIAALSNSNWQAAHDELLDSAAARQLPSRYQPLANILLTGAA